MESDKNGGERAEVQRPIELQTDTPPDAGAGDEYMGTAFGAPSIRNVTVPTITPIIPLGSNVSRPAVIVAPGGGFQFLFAETEGYAVARRLAKRGICTFVLKYRVEPSPEDDRQAEPIISQRLHYLSDPGKRFSLVTSAEHSAIRDGESAVRLVRELAPQWGVAPSSVGFLGFAAGGLIAGGLASAPRIARPDFLGIIYSFFRGSVPEAAPPVFIAAAADDHLLEDKPIEMYRAWRAAGCSSELHLYERGGGMISLARDLISAAKTGLMTLFAGCAIETLNDRAKEK